MYKPAAIPDILEYNASAFPERIAFINRDGGSFSFSQLYAHSRFVAGELGLLRLSGRAAAIIGEVTYCGLTAMLGCLMSAVPFIVPDPALSDEELAGMLSDMDVGAVFYSAKRKDRAEAIGSLIHDVLLIPEFEQLFPAENFSACPDLPGSTADDPAFTFFTATKKAVVLSHKNICTALYSVANALDISSYTFLSPAVWGNAFDCVIGLLLPLYAGCGVVKRGEKRSVARAIAESGATALTCTPERLRSLEKTLRSRSAKVFGKAKTLLPDILGAAMRAVGIGTGKRTFRRIHSLMGDNLKIIICGGAYPDRDCIRQFLNWGFDVYNCYFLTECGAVAMSAVPGGRPVPLTELEIYPTVGDYGEIQLCGDSIADCYFGGKELPRPFRTGDIGRLYEDGTLEISGKRRTMLMSGEGAPVFPEEIAAVLCRSRYISRCTISGRFDTGTAGILVSASVTPDYRAVASALGQKYSENRLRLFLGRELEKLSPQLPHKINDFRLVGKGSEKGLVK
ncbi:MAG: acyl--CoA ligase [Oscillospiraceae bacterium]|nr:acyl--CoA ligase [Oscillospiraceae bacterium]